MATKLENDDMTLKLPDETYLGDGLYCALQAGSIVLRAPRYDMNADTTNDHYVYLEPETYEALRKYATRIGWELPDEDAP